jgi:hypothetical protein
MKKMKKREIVVYEDWTQLVIEETEKGYFINAYGDGEATLEISKETFEMILKDYLKEKYGNIKVTINE